MAAEKTPDKITKESAGSLILTIAKYDASVISGNDIDDGDYWTSKIQGIVGYWGSLSQNPTTTGTGEGIDITLTTANTGKFTFNVGEDSCTGVIYVLSRS